QSLPQGLFPAALARPCLKMRRLGLEPEQRSLAQQFLLAVSGKIAQRRATLAEQFEGKRLRRLRPKPLRELARRRIQHGPEGEGRLNGRGGAFPDDVKDDMVVIRIGVMPVAVPAGLVKIDLDVA